MYNAIYTTAKSADVLVLGSSRTMNGINDSLANTLGNTKFLNLGYCRYGRNLDYFFADEYCKKHKPSVLIIEVRESEGDNTHPVTAFFLPAKSITEGLLTGNADVPIDLYNKWLCNLKFLRTALFGEKTHIEKRVISHGFWYGNTPENIEALTTTRKKDSLHYATLESDHEPLNSNSKHYLEKINQLANQKNIQLYFLYMSSYGNTARGPAQANDYLKYGKLLLPPDSILCDPHNYSNFSHFNKRGADKLSAWLTSALNAAKDQ